MKKQLLHIAYITLGILIAAGTSAAVTGAAQSAYPGDLLYPYKLAYVERITYTLTPKAAQRDADFSALEERLTEALTLAKRGTLTTNEERVVLGAVDGHLSSILSYITQAEAAQQYADAADTAAQLQTVLATQNAKLTDAATGASTNTQVTIEPLLLKIRLTEHTARSFSRKLATQALALKNK